MEKVVRWFCRRWWQFPLLLLRGTAMEARTCAEQASRRRGGGRKRCCDGGVVAAVVACEARWRWWWRGADSGKVLHVRGCWCAVAQAKVAEVCVSGSICGGDCGNGAGAMVRCLRWRSAREDGGVLRVGCCCGAEKVRCGVAAVSGEFQWWPARRWRRRLPW